MLTTIHIENVDQIPRLPSELMEELIPVFGVPEDKQVD